MLNEWNGSRSPTHAMALNVCRAALAGEVAITNFPSAGRLISRFSTRRRKKRCHVGNLLTASTSNVAWPHSVQASDKPATKETSPGD